MANSAKRNRPKQHPPKDSGRAKNARMVHRAKVDPEGKIPVETIESEPEKTASAYDQVIKEYESYYQQTSAGGAGNFSYDPYSFYCSQQYGGTPYADQLGEEYNQTFAQYGERLQMLEQAQADFTASIPYIQGLTGDERQVSIKAWKEYLQSLMGIGKELTDSLEASIQALSPKTP